MGKEIDPADIGKHADLIKKAQSDIVYSDVLVCGRCHTVFHLVEVFQEHKENEPECRRATNALHQCDEAQAKVWAFLLWKSAQRNAISNEGDKSGGNNSWKLYQSWVKLDESVRDTWIVAGKTIQSFTRIGSGNLQEMPVKITKTILETDSGRAPSGAPGAANAANRATLQGRKPGDLKPAAGGLGSPDAKRATPAGGLVGAAGRKPEPNNPAALKPGVTKRAFAKRTSPKTGETVEEEVEKILAKRFSPVIKMHEYLVKWSKMGNDQNTWEPLTHLHSCQSILEYFEVQLAKQKEQRAATAARTLQQQQQSKAKTIGTPTTAAASNAAGVTNVTRSPLSPQRPGRFSKTSALDRVKMWTSGNRSPGDSADGGGDDAVGVKRKLEDTDTDHTGADSTADGSGKRAKTEPHMAISEALSKVSQTGNVKILPVSAAGSKPSPSGATVNGSGTGDVSQKTADAAEVLIIKSPRDSTVPSGITRKPGVPSSGTSPRGEAKVKIVNRSEPVAHGIFKVGTDAGTGTPVQTSSHVVTTSVAVPAAATRPVPIATNTPNSVMSGDVTTRFVRRNVDGTQQLVKQTIRKATKFVSSTPTAQRPGGVPTRVVGGAVATQQKTVPSVVSSVAGVQQRTATTSPRVAITGTPAARVGVKGSAAGAGIMRTAISTTPTVTPTAAPAAPAAPAGPSSEQKINALRKQGLNVVKRSVPAGSAATKKVTAGMATKAEEDDEGQGDGFPSNLALPVPLSPPRALTLCPVTGKVLGQAEGEPTPVPSPEETESGTTDDKSGSGHQKTESGVLAEQQHQLTDPQTEVHQLLTNEDGSPIIVAGEDGTLYQVAGKNAEGQTILIAQGADGEQSCVLMAAQEGEDDITNGAASGVLTLDAAVSEAVAQVGQEGQQLSEDQVVQFQQVSGTPNQQLTIQTEDSQDGQITAEIVQAGQPSPGGTRQVVLMLPNGSFMMTEVTEEQYQSLNLNNPTEE